LFKNEIVWTFIDKKFLMMKIDFFEVRHSYWKVMKFTMLWSVREC